MEILENLGTLGVPLGLGILGNTRENVETPGTLARAGKPGRKLGKPLGLEILGKLGQTWKIQEP